MQTASQPNPTPAIEQLVAVAQELPLEQLIEVLDFALFLQSRATTEADAAWDEALENTTPEQAARIQARIESQRTRATPLFGASGKVSPPVVAASEPASKR
jgi:hypothetical protein